MSRVRLVVAPAAKLPPPGTAAVELFACDLGHPAGERAVRQFGGEPLVTRLRKHGNRWVGIVAGPGGVIVVPYETEANLLELGAHALDITPYMPGPVVMLPFGGPELRRKLLAAARERELEMADAEGLA
jgi:hypothetical protein